ncbi:hypothetical protein [Burkholderia glumae]|uniref:hypothetical protein n=1 Tax=Burkholderia glumae TaxID=337 RepID=UPI00163ACE31|nr:hypothetical protein [Burkholderia glumae]
MSENNTTAPALTDEQRIRASMTGEQIRLERKLTCEAIEGAIGFGQQGTNPPPSDDHWLAPFWKIGQQLALLTSPRAAVPADRRKDFETAMAAIPVEDGNPTSFIRDGDDSYVQHHVESAWLGFSLACQMLDASPAAPVDEYDGNHVQNHCPECNEHEAECSCAQAVAADGAATKDDVDALTFALGASVMIEGGEKYREALKRMLDRERAAVSPATAHTPLNGIAATMFHGEGAIARCSYCGRYSLDRKTLGDRPPKCECGEKHGWSGSFEKPGPDAKWSGAAPSGMPATADEREAPADWREAFNERHEFDIYPDDFMTGLRNEFAAGWYAALKTVGASQAAAPAEAREPQWSRDIIADLQGLFDTEGITESTALPRARAM